MDKATVIKLTKGKTTAQLVDLIVHIVKRNPETHTSFLEWCSENETEENITNVNDKLILQYWKSLKKIIDFANDYGGYDYDDDDAYEGLNKIAEMAQNEKISWATRKMLIGDMIIGAQYDSGFTDELIDTCKACCYEENDWLYLIEKLTDTNGWFNETAMSIYLNELKDENSYLAMRLLHMNNASDYMQLAEFYQDKGDIKTAIEYAEAGLLKTDNYKGDLFRFLFEIYSRDNDDANVDRLFTIAKASERSAVDMAEKVFEYYKNKDYQKAKAAIMLIYQNGNSSNSYDVYNILSKFIHKDEWEKTEPEIFVEIQKKNIVSYLNICLDKGLKEIVLSAITGNKPLYDDYDFSFSQRLKTDYPNEIIEKYMGVIDCKINCGDRKTYKEAVDLLLSVKKIYKTILSDGATFNRRVNELREKYKKRPAFLDEAKKL